MNRRLTENEIQELSDSDYCNPDGVFDYYLFARLIEATVQGVDLEETSFQTALSKEMKGKAQEK